MNTNDVKKGLYFILGIITLFYIIRYVIFEFIDLYFLRLYTAGVSWFFLQFMGISSSLSPEGPFIFFPNGTAEIIDLCSGAAEIALVFAVTISTWDLQLKKRIIGALFGIGFVLLVNPFRIAATIASAYYFGWGFAELFHTILFKTSLVLFTAGYYTVWYLWALNKIKL